MLLNTTISNQGSNKTRQQDDDNNRHPHQSFIYNTSLTDMLIYSRSGGVSVDHLSADENLLDFG